MNSVELVCDKLRKKYGLNLSPHILSEVLRDCDVELVAGVKLIVESHLDRHKVMDR